MPVQSLADEQPTQAPELASQSGVALGQDDASVQAA
jgi:hypothetical protein